MFSKGDKINDRYEIIKLIGEGGMANVYLAYDTILERNVAVKVLRGDLADDEKFVRRFQREALSASSLSHPNIVEMYDVGEDNGNFYIVMEYIDGQTLKQLIKKRGHLTVPEAIDIMLQLTDGLAHAHDSYIIHRDIKPQNIMIEDNGRIKITDFGIAMALNSTQLTQTNSVMGSVHYLPPEQANGKGSTVKSDIYSLGILMYELLTGSVPFKGDTAVEIALKHMKEKMPSVRKQNPTIPQSVENIILKATAKNPKNRYDSVREMYNDLQTALERDNEKRLVYEYPENDLDETKALDKELENVKKQQAVEEKKKAKKIEEETKKENKKQNKLLIILASIFTGLVLLLTIGISLYFNKSKVKNVVIPDVSNKAPVDASNQLTDLGFEVVTEYKYIASDTIEEGKVVKTSPEIGSKRKYGQKITLYISSGEGAYVVEDFTGENYLVAKGKIEAQCQCNVIVEYEKVKEEDKIKEDTVIKTEPPAGESSKYGSQIKIFIPQVEYKYPDFTKYSISELEEFVSKHELKLEYKYQEDLNKPEGTIIKQSRAKDSVVTPGATLVITVTTKPEESTDDGVVVEE